MKKLTITLLVTTCVLSILFSCKKDSTIITTEKVKAPILSPILAEITSFVLTQMPNKTMPTATNNGDWDLNQSEEEPEADVMINVLDSIPYYALYGTGNLPFNLKKDSLPKTFGKESFKIRNLQQKFNLIMLDWDKNYESEQMALIPFRLSDYKATKPTKIYLNAQGPQDTSHTKITLNVIWY